jgi:hypothetical protein
MYAVSKRDRDRIDGLAAFAAAAFLTGLGLVAALARVGAPDRLVEALGPLIALVGLAIIGALNRSARLADFLAARRAVPPAYGGLAFAATAVGFVLSLDGGLSGRGPLPWLGLALGLAGAALIAGPFVRRSGAGALSDVLATRFPAAPTRWAFALVLTVAGALTATAGLETAVDLIVAHVGQDRRAAEVIVALSLAMTVVPGGLKGLLWSDAASAGGALAIAAIGAALAWSGGAPVPPLAETAQGWLGPSALHADSASLLFEAATAFGVGAFFAFVPASIGAPPGQTSRTGLFGLAFTLAGVALGAFGLAAFWPGSATAAHSSTASALVGAATGLPALALARAGVCGAARAAGIDLSTAYARLTVLASVRLARIRLTMLAVIVLAAVAADHRLIGPPAALTLALALNLALIAPALVLGPISGGRSWTAAAALAAGLAVLAWRRYGVAAPFAPSDLMISALIAGAAALLAGAVVGVIAPARGGARKGGARSDPFVDLPFETPT